MPQYRNVSADDRAVAYGVLRPQWVAAGGIITVADTVAPSFDCQPDIWARADGSAAPAAAVAVADPPPADPAGTEPAAAPTAGPAGEPIDPPSVISTPAEPAQPTLEQPS